MPSDFYVLTILLVALFAFFALTSVFNLSSQYLLHKRGVTVDADNHSFSINGSKYNFLDIEYVLNQGNYASYGGLDEFRRMYVLRMKNGQQFFVSTVFAGIYNKFQLIEHGYSEYMSELIIQDLNCGVSHEIGNIIFNKDSIYHLVSKKNIVPKSVKIDGHDLRIVGNDEVVHMNLNTTPNSILIIHIFKKQYGLALEAR